MRTRIIPFQLVKAALWITLSTTIACGDDPAGIGIPGGGATGPSGGGTVVGERITSEVKQLIVMGDSISHGAGASDTSLAYGALLHRNNDAVYPGDALNDLTSLFNEDLEYIPVAIPGATTSSMVRDQLRTLERRFGDTPVEGHTVVVATIGGNDITQNLFGDPAGLPLDNAIDNLKTFITFFKDTQRFPDGTTLFLSDVYDPSDGMDGAATCFMGARIPGVSDKVKTWQSRYRALAQDEPITIVNALDSFYGHGHNNQDSSGPHYKAGGGARWFHDDCIHPNDLGHQQFRRLFYNAIAIAAAVRPS